MANNRVNVDLDLSVEGYVQGMDKATDSTKAYETETRKIQDSMVNLNKEFRKAKKDAQDLAAGYAQLTDEEKNSTFGQEIAAQLEQAKQKAADFLDMKQDLDQELRNMASDTATFDAITDGLSGMANGLSAVQGVMGIFTNDTEAMTRAITLFTTAESISNAAIKLKNTLLPQSKFMLGINRVQTLALTAAENLNTAAKSKNAVAAGAATVAQKALNAAAKANPYVLLATAILGVVSAYTIFTSGAEDAEKAQERLNAKLVEGTDAAINFANAMNEAYNNALRYYSEIGSSDEIINNQKLIASQKHLKDLETIYAGLTKGKNESDEQWQQRQDKVLKEIDATRKSITNLKEQVLVHNKAVEYLKKNWQNLNTDKEISAAISAFQNLRNEAKRGSAEYKDLTTKIETLQKKLNSTKNNTPKKTNTKIVKNEIDTYAEAVAEYDKLAKELENLINLMNTGRIDTSKFEEVEKEADKIESKMNKLANTWSIKAKVEIEVEQNKDISDIQERISKAITPDILVSTKYDFSYLPKEFNKSANQVISDMQRIEAESDKMVEDMRNETSDTRIAAMQDGIVQLEAELDRLGEKANVYQELADAAKILEDENKKLETSMNAAGDALANLGSMFKSIGDMADNKSINIAGIIAQAVANYILGWTEATAKAAKLGPIGWLGFGLSTAAQMFAMVSQIKQAGKFAQGGTVGGSSYYGDKLMAFVNSGETILTRDQTKNVVNAIDNNKLDKQIIVIGETRLRGSDLYISYKNFEKSHNISTNKYSIYQ